MNIIFFRSYDGKYRIIVSFQTAKVDGTVGAQGSTEFSRAGFRYLCNCESEKGRRISKRGAGIPLLFMDHSKYFDTNVSHNPLFFNMYSMISLIAPRPPGF